MQKISRYLKSPLFYVQILTLATIFSAFVPALNPLVSYGNQEHHMLFSIFTDLGEVEKYFESVLTSFDLFSKILFVAMILFYVGLVCYICGLILIWAKSSGGKHSIFTGSIIFMIVYFVLFFAYYSINSELLFNGNELIASKIDVWLKIPFGIYYHFFLSVAVAVLTVLASGADLKAFWYRIHLNWIHRFKGGVYPTPHKNTRSKPIETMAPQSRMIYPLLQHVGTICEPCVKIGDYVRMGQKIADSTDVLSVPIHATVSGTVVDIAEWDHPTEKHIPAIIIENDFEDNHANYIDHAGQDYTSRTPEELIEMVHQAGIVGMGGTAFPTHVKLASAVGSCDALIVNAAECEPYLSSDHRVILESTDELIGGIDIVRHITNAKQICIGIENNKPDAISLLHKRLSKSNIRIEILKTKYPQGGEKQLIRAVTGRIVPAGKLPADIGCLVLNVDTVIAIYRAVVNGIPLMRRIVTVAGHGVERTGNIHVRIGTPFSAVLDHFGYKYSTRKLIMGGPMMGIAQSSLDAPVIKSTSGLICMTRDQIAADRDATCIRCGSCVSACPMQLVPSYIAQFVQAGRFELADKLHINECIECGCCSFICPVKIPLIKYMRIGKTKTLNEMPKGDEHE